MTVTEEAVDCVVIGAGVVGLAVARALALVGREVLVLDASDAIGTQTSSRNSEVIHAGIYYPTGSLKAALCVKGKEALYDYCSQRGIGHRRCGKLIVATDAAQVDQLHKITAHASANGVTDLQFLDAHTAISMEPALRCVAALFSPSTGILDSHAFMLSLLGDLENAGGQLVVNTRLDGAGCDSAGISLRTADGTRLRAALVVNATGLHAPRLALAFDGYDPIHAPCAFYCKGNYFTLSGKSPFSRLIYPVPEAAGLGVHLTLDLAGQAKFGPDVQWVEGADDLAVDPQRSASFYGQIRRYWPELQDGALQVGYAGIRPKISGPADPTRDFCIQGPQVHGVPGLVHLFGIESPGLTSALAIGDVVAQLLCGEPVQASDSLSYPRNALMASADSRTSAGPR
jgi:L-2-hydroxyglutarate oxidase LhgO